MSIHKTKKTRDWNVGEVTKRLGWFLYKWKEREGSGIFAGETCELLVVRGTTLFCNNKITILPIGESTVWNVQMWWNEQCWRGTILFSAVFH